MESQGIPIGLFQCLHPKRIHMRMGTDPCTVNSLECTTCAHVFRLYHVVCRECRVRTVGIKPDPSSTLELRSSWMFKISRHVAGRVRRRSQGSERAILGKYIGAWQVLIFPYNLGSCKILCPNVTLLSPRPVVGSVFPVEVGTEYVQLSREFLIREISIKEDTRGFFDDSCFRWCF